MSQSAMQPLLDAVAATIPEERGVQTELAEVLNVSQPFVSKCIKRGWFPIDRARTLSDKYGVPFPDLVQSRLRDLINQ